MNSVGKPYWDCQRWIANLERRACQGAGDLMANLGRWQSKKLKNKQKEKYSLRITFKNYLYGRHTKWIYKTIFIVAMQISNDVMQIEIKYELYWYQAKS